MIVVADTSPLNYLVLIEHVDLLPRLYQRIAVPQAVWQDLQHPDSPAKVQDWCRVTPVWLQVHPFSSNRSPVSKTVHPGEAQAIVLAEDLNAAALIVDDWNARQEAERRNIPTLGTLRILQDAAEQDWINLPEALKSLCQTNFRVRQSLIDALWARDAKRRHHPQAR